MTEMFAGMVEIISALFDNDAFMLQDAMRNNPGIWPLGLIATLGGGFLIMLIYRHVPIVERYLEPSVMVASYLAIGYIIFSGVVQRFFLSGQPPWSTTLPPFLFLVMTWVGCSYNVKLRTHLAFAEFRMAMPRFGQLLCLLLDALLWLGFAWIVIVTATQETVRAAANFSIMLGTDDVMQWWFLISVPLAFLLLSGRVLEHLFNDLRNFRAGETMIKQAVIGGDA